MPQERLILAGQFGAAVGVKGEIRIRSFTSSPLAIANYSSLRLDDGTPVKILALRDQGKALVARVDGIGDRTAAEKLTGRELFILRDELPEPENADEFYIADLVGMEVRDPAGIRTGKIIAVHDFGAGDILEIKPISGAAFMASFTKAAFPVVDLSCGYLTFVPPAEISDREDGRER